MNAPCYMCKDRCIGCHAKCDKYTVYHEMREKILEERHKDGIENSPSRAMLPKRDYFLCYSR